MKPYALALLTLLVAAACAPQTGRSTKKDGTPVAAAPKSTVTAQGGVVATAKGNSVALPPGSLAIGTEVSVSEVTAPAEFTANGALAASAPVEVLAKDANGVQIDNVGQAAAPATIALSIDEATAFALGADKTDANLCVLLKTHSNALYVWRFAALRVDAAAQKVEVASYFFGTFQVVYCGQDPLANFADSSAQKEALEQVAATPAGGAKSELSIAIPAGIFTQVGHARYCLALLGEQDETAAAAGSGSGEKGPAVIAVSGPVDATGTADAALSLEADPVAVEGYHNVYVGLTMHASGVACPFVVGAPVKNALALAEPLGVYVWQVDKSAVEKGLSGTVGDAAGPFRTGAVTVEVGANGLPEFSPFAVAEVCLDVDYKDGAKTLQRAAIETSGSAALLHGEGKYKMVTALPPGTVGEYEFNVRIGETCNSFDPGSAGPKADGQPYYVTFRGGGDDAHFMIAPTKLVVSNKNPLTSVLSGCLEICPSEADCTSVKDQDQKNGGQATVKLADGATTPLYLPFLAAPLDASGHPVFDMTIRILKAGATCRSYGDVTAGLPSVPLSGKALSPSISVNLP